MAKAPKRTGGRPRFPEPEKRHQWLPMLLDAYAIFDRGVHAALAAEQKLGRTPACKKGCTGCCHNQKGIPVYPLEMVGIFWYVGEQMGGPLRETVRGQLETFAPGGLCPFVVDGGCAIYPMRPAACRQFNVFGEPCGQGEDPFHTRREDVMRPLREYRDRAFMAMMPFYGIEDKKAQQEALRIGLLDAKAVNLRTVDWGRLLGIMAELDRRREGEK